MRCIAYCTAFSYKLRPLYGSLHSHYQATLLRDVIHIELDGNQGGGDAFFFSYGTLVLWSVDEAIETCLLSQVKEFEEAPLDKPERDFFEYAYGDNVKVREDEIILPDDGMLTKLAIAHGLAQSVKLSSFEKILQETYNATKQLPDELARFGRISPSRRSMRKQMGHLFNVRSSINLGLDVLISPDFFWDYPQLEPLYNQVAVDEELHKRVDVLNKRLGILHDLVEMLGNELNHQHSSRLEWTIIWLIIIEVLLTVLRDVLRIL